jgi:hypothetical protein
MDVFTLTSQIKLLSQLYIFPNFHDYCGILDNKLQDKEKSCTQRFTW